MTDVVHETCRHYSRPQCLEFSIELVEGRRRYGDSCDRSPSARSQKLKVARFADLQNTRVICALYPRDLRYLRHLRMPLPSVVICVICGCLFHLWLSAPSADAFPICGYLRHLRMSFPSVVICVICGCLSNLWVICGSRASQHGQTPLAPRPCAERERCSADPPRVPARH
jgi:hypothetical protein